MKEKNKLKFGDHLVFFIALFVLGFILILAVKSEISANQIGEPDHNAVLIAMIEEMERENGALEASIAAIMNSAEQLRSSDDFDAEALAEITERNQSLRKNAGMTEIGGDGLEIVLNDSEEAANGEFPREAYIVHDKNLLYLVNDLRPFCEAISINGQRVVTITDIRCVGTVILVNQTRLAPPYQILCIGSQTKLMAALEKSSEYKSILASPLRIDVHKKSGLTVPAFKGFFEFHFATIVEEAGAAAATAETTPE